MRKPSPIKRATLEDVARAAGVGPMTVSRTINGHPYVADETARRVHEAIRRLGYRPNHAARILTGQLSKSIGLIVPDLADTFFSVVSHAVQEAAREAGYLVWLAASNGDPSIEEAQVEQMANHPVDGILLVPADSRARYLKAAALRSTPIVTIDRPIEVAQTDSVEVENRAGARMAVEHLLSHGYKRIACVVMNSHLQPVRERIVGYEECLKSTKLSRIKKVMLSSEVSAPKALSALFDSPDRPDALFTANNACTITVIKILKAMKIKVPRDVALIGFDDVDFYTLLNPPLTTVRQPATELGRASARLLLKRIRGESSSSIAKTVLPVTLVIRESCGCKNRR
ncbi:LacI family DNA-binding transcriptional regulator [Granulicella sp. dw_53]|uniref:LacI family DNA-binding transcriptional regulator n=1 Tax=Granulicella sp. dw_53 TaxID=2719792 RepID=UPI0031F6F845